MAPTVGAEPVIRDASYKPVGALLAGLKVLRYMAQAKSPLPLSRITRDLGLNSSTCLNILRTLTRENYLVFDPHSKLYSMGLGVLELVNGAISQGGDLRAIRSLTEQISTIERVTITLWRRVQRDRIMLVLESLPAGDINIKMNIGQRLPLLVGAAGRLMVGFSSLTEEDIYEQFQKVRWEKPISFREYIREVEEARERGWAVDHERYVVGAASIAVPVVNEHGEAVFALSATMFSAHFSMERAETLAGELMRPAQLLASAIPHL